MDDKEIKLIEKYITPETIMLEWGAGGSTTRLGKLVKQYFSIESDKEWLDKVSLDIGKNTEIFYRPAPNKEDVRYSSYDNYQHYVDTGGHIAAACNIKFDIVLIDGRARVACAKYIIPYLSDNAVVFVHDFWKPTRERYKPILDYYNEIESVKSTHQTIVALRAKQ